MSFSYFYSIITNTFIEFNLQSTKVQWSDCGFIFFSSTNCCSSDEQYSHNYLNKVGVTSKEKGRPLLTKGLFISHRFDLRSSGPIPLSLNCTVRHSQPFVSKMPDIQLLGKSKLLPSSISASIAEYEQGICHTNH